MKKSFLQGGVRAVIATLCVSFAAVSIAPASAETRHTDDEWRALMACKAAIRQNAGYGVIKAPGNRLNTGRGDSFAFVWPRGTFVLENGFGASVKSEAVCLGSLARCEIDGLMLNGSVVIDTGQAVRFTCDG